MAVHKWSELMAKLPKERQERIRRATKEEVARLEVLELNLSAMRELLGKTQSEVALEADLSQAELSRAERREDHLVSTLRRYVEALGGKLEVIADFGDRMIRLRGV